MNKIYAFKKVSSTMALARRLADKGHPAGTIVTARTQSNGRGQFGRKWASPWGGLYLSIILRPAINSKNIPKLNSRVSFLVAKILKKLYKLPVKLKLPNDILVNGKKISGVLIETSFSTNKKLNWIIAGIGINVNTTEFQLRKVGTSATSVQIELGRKVSLKKLTNMLSLKLLNL